MSAIELMITPREKDLGGFTVGRILPFAKRRMVGPFIFLDHIGPAEFAPGKGIDVRPHPHIGLATVTYLFAGEIFHRDTLGSAQAITAGAVNWMTAGRGIAHSERTAPEEKRKPHPLHGLQSWIALPKEAEETAPEFYHHPAASLPEFTLGGVKLRVIAGSAYEHEAPVRIFSPLFYVEAHMPAGSRLEMPQQYAERAAYLLEGNVRVAASPLPARSMAVFEGGARVVLEAEEASHLMLLGGEPLPEQRFIWWNFVSSSQERLEQAKADWQAGKFGTVPGDEKEFIPLPE